MPADHEWFKNTNAMQWHWYLQNIIKDQEEDFKTQRNLLEYHVSFLEPELVEKVRKRRDEQDASNKKDDNFAQTLKSMFGRDVEFKGTPSNESDFKDVQEVSDVLDKIKAYDAAQKTIKSKSVYNFTDWIDFDLE